MGKLNMLPGNASTMFPLVPWTWGFWVTSLNGIKGVSEYLAHPLTYLVRLRYILNLLGMFGCTQHHWFFFFWKFAWRKRKGLSIINDLLHILIFNFMHFYVLDMTIIFYILKILLVFAMFLSLPTKKLKGIPHEHWDLSPWSPLLHGKT